ncbi:MAG TPA: hypothetical protein VE442_10610 [Jatrophihabitans sp.]|nr:hypothetical protein [Jatrophihabitans sp.]
MGDPTSPPGPLDTWLGETVVHSTDIRWSVGIEHAFAPETLARAADFHKASNLLIGAKNRIAGRTRRATDTDWTHGSGPEVTSPMLALVMAMTGRRAALERLSGSGLAA